MTQPYVGEIRCFPANFAPAGWMFCSGQLLPISEYETLFALIGTTYGGDGQSTFALPNLQGRAPLHQGTGPDGTNYTLAQITGAENVTLTTNQIPAHTHTLTAMVVAPGGAPERVATPTSASYVGATNPDGLYNTAPTTAPASLNATFSASAVGGAGASIPHENLQPYLALNFIISLFGIFPSQS